ncbi:DUF5132 domain-containing protein [Paraburkholderia diazotrophica]|uniref:DUF5132 domain-containing protein n=1 Tax=Paraburkholderia diazotrophica TaxID=667676 RepID=UPI00316C336C
MAGPEDIFKGSVLAGLAVGVGAIVLAPVVLPVVAAVSRPIAKSAMKTGVILFEKGREAAAEMREVFEDLVAEARAELDESRPGASFSASPGSSETSPHMADAEREGAPQ